MRGEAEKMRNGDLSLATAVLTTQSRALNTMFTNSAEPAQNHKGIAQIHCVIGLALRSRPQSRATKEALAEIWNPCPAAFVRHGAIAPSHSAT